jgi:D-glycero-D-manno-heptose 1,7-bisphosphate phosphatase
MPDTPRHERTPWRLRGRASPGPPHGRSKAVFLDRDGVLNEVVGDGARARSPRGAGDLVLTDGAKVATRRLAACGYRLIAVTNQPDVARGLMTAAVAEALTRSTMEQLQLDDAYVCPHDGPDRCSCRKPGPGMLLAARRDWAIELGSSWLIGDRWVDIGAAQAAGVRSVLLEARYSWDPSGGVEPPPGLEPTLVAADLTTAVDAILNAPPR